MLVDKQRAIQYPWEAASAKTEKFAETAKNPLIAPHPRFIKSSEDPASHDGVSSGNAPSVIASIDEALSTNVMAENDIDAVMPEAATDLQGGIAIQIC